jgi:amino-acid N-acetyltransferase
MNVRSAKVSDAKTIFTLINDYAEQDKMLFRSMADIYENIRSFYIAESEGKFAGCCCLHIIWADLAEIKSLAVDKDFQGKGVGKALIKYALKQAKELGLKKVFALTLEPDFFKKAGFETIEMEKLPMKVWSDCARCPKQNKCDEIAVIKDISEEGRGLFS